ncbi:MAG: S41 family peptidase [Phocaeicola sp.]
MKRIASLSTLLLLLLITSNSCIREEQFDDSPQGNFEALWKIIDERYCFLEYKKESYGLDWNEIYSEYKNRITSNMTKKQLFDVLSEMVNELKDGHVNLVSADRVSQYREWYDAYPRNFDDSIQSIYLGKDYEMVSGLKYKILEQNVAYVYCASFQSGMGDGNLDEILNLFSLCDGLIIDVRNNGGGNLTTAQKLAARFTNERVLTGYISYKTGTGHFDFSTPKAVYLDSPSDRVRWQKPVVVLTNRRSYSATNDFANMMKELPLATLIGDKTGGGSGLPFSSELPNGWSIRFSASPMFSSSMEQIEFGIDPDIKVNISPEDYRRGVDTIIEAAIALIRSK